MSDIKSPFILMENYIPLELCDQIVNSNRPKFPQQSKDKKPAKTTYFSELSENRLLPYVDQALDIAEPYFEFQTEEIKQLRVEWYPENSQPLPPQADGAPMVFGVHKDSQLVNFTMLFFLKEAAYGGKLEFTNHKFTLTPKAGTLIIYPSNSNFISTFTGVGSGDLTCARIMVKALNGYRYDMRKFKGNYTVWF